MDLKKLEVILNCSTIWIVRRQTGARFVIQSLETDSSLKVYYAGDNLLIETWSPATFVFDLSESVINDVLPAVLQRNNAHQGTFVSQTFDKLCRRCISIDFVFDEEQCDTVAELKVALESRLCLVAENMRPRVTVFERGLILDGTGWRILVVEIEDEDTQSFFLLKYCPSEEFSIASECLASMNVAIKPD